MCGIINPDARKSSASSYTTDTEKNKQKVTSADIT
jgi:hypothetical protein